MNKRHATKAKKSQVGEKKKLSFGRKALVTLGLILFIILLALSSYTLYISSFQHKYREKEIITSINVNGEPQKQSYIISGSASLNYKALSKRLSKEKPVVIVSVKNIDDYYFLKSGVSARWANYGNMPGNKAEYTAFEHVKLFLRRLFLGVYFSSKVELIDEKSMAEKHNYVFYKLPLYGKQPPDEEAVAHLRKILLDHPGAHIHFHCNHGCGRTTSAMAVATFFLSNSSLADIISDMYDLGGVNLSDIRIWKRSTYTQAELTYRYNKIKEIYEYARAVGLEGTMSLSEWRAEHPSLASND